MTINAYCSQHAGEDRQVDHRHANCPKTVYKYRGRGIKPEDRKLVQCACACHNPEE